MHIHVGMLVRARACTHTHTHTHMYTHAHTQTHIIKKGLHTTDTIKTIIFTCFCKIKTHNQLLQVLL